MNVEYADTANRSAGKSLGVILDVEVSRGLRLPTHGGWSQLLRRVHLV